MMLPSELPVSTTQVIVSVPDVDTLEARVARIEALVAEMHAIILPLQEIVRAVNAEMAEKGPAGMLGMLIGAMRS